VRGDSWSDVRKNYYDKKILSHSAAWQRGVQHIELRLGKGHGTYNAVLLQWRVRRKKRDFRASKTTSAAHHVIVHICTIVYQWRVAGDLV